MTDARLPDRWLNDRRFIRLFRDSELFESYMMALLYSVTNRTDGFIAREDVALGIIPYFADRAPDALVELELSAVVDGGWLLVDYPTTQTTRDEFARIDRLRAGNRERQQRKRDRETAAEDGDVDKADVTRDVTRDVLGKARQGQARQGEARTTHLSNQRSLSNPSPLERNCLDEEKNSSFARSEAERLRKSGTSLEDDNDDNAALDVETVPLDDEPDEPLMCGLCGQPDADPNTGMHPKCSDVIRFRQRTRKKPPA
jgi:hypothetical protein